MPKTPDWYDEDHRRELEKNFFKQLIREPTEREAKWSRIASWVVLVSVILLIAAFAVTAVIATVRYVR